MPNFPFLLNETDMIATTPLRLLIFGSCVSRDILNYLSRKEDIPLVDYYARCSLASLGLKPLDEPVDVAKISSVFQRRMVERDIKKTFLDDLGRLEFDVLLLDFIDERFDLYANTEGAGCTLSNEFNSSGFQGSSATGQTVASGSEEFWSRWEAGWALLVNRLKELEKLDRVVVNRVYWSTNRESGGGFEPSYSRRGIDAANRFLDRMYERIGRDLRPEQFMRFDPGLFTGAENHRWGHSPFHYIDAYYHDAIRQLTGHESLPMRKIFNNTELTTAPVFVEIRVAPGKPVNASAVFGKPLPMGKTVLALFDFGATDVNTVKLGLLRSGDPAIGIFRYLDPDPGSGAVSFSFDAPEGCTTLKIGLRARYPHDRITLSSFDISGEPEKEEHAVFIERSPVPAVEAPPYKPTSFISFDVEALPLRAAQDHVNRLIWGKTPGGEFGIRRISDILGQYGIKGNFLVDIAGCVLHGDRAMKEVMDYLLSEGHDVQAHLHPEWLVRNWGLKGRWEGPPGMDNLDVETSRSFMDYTAFKFRELLDRDPLVFRAGGCRFNANTVDAARRAGFKALSNYLAERNWGQTHFKGDELAREPFTWDGGIHEIPIDLVPEPLSFDPKKIDGAFDRLRYKKTVKTFNVLLHSWSLLNRGQDGMHHELEPLHEQRLHELCARLKEHTNPETYSNYISSISAACKPPHKTIEITSDKVNCAVCRGIFDRSTFKGDICPGCGSRARHRQVMDVFERTGNPFDGRSVLACHANTIEKTAWLSKSSLLVNFDVRPVGYCDFQMDIQNMDLIDDESFEAFLALHVLNHVTDDRLALKEVRRVLRPGGIALITIPYRNNEPTKPYEKVTETYGEEAFTKYGVGSYRWYGLDDAKTLFEEEGFSVELHEGIDPITKQRLGIFILKRR